MILFIFVSSYSNFMQQGIKSNPSLVQKLRATFLKVRNQMGNHNIVTGTVVVGVFSEAFNPFTPDSAKFKIDKFSKITKLREIEKRTAPQ